MIRILLLLLITANCLGQTDFAKKYSNEFDSNLVKQHLTFLSSDLFGGRGTGSIGENLAAKYIAWNLNSMNIEPFGNNNSYYQQVLLHGSLPKEPINLKIYINNDTFKLNFNEDLIINKPSYRSFIPNPTEIVFVGYGIIAPEYDYNDYLDIDVTNKIVVFIDGEPQSYDSSYFMGPKPTIYGYINNKMITAFARGAIGTILIPSPISYNYTEWNSMINTYKFEDVILAFTVSSNLSLIINPSVANLLFLNSKYSLQDIYKMHFKNEMKHFKLQSKLTFQANYNRRDFISSNIIGFIEGKDEKLKDEYIIVSAHYDHLGIGPKISGDSIYNGLLDNALGVATLLELAKLLNYAPKSTKRSIIFLFTCAEEKGTLGATYYTNHPKVPLHKTVCNINIDGVPFIDEFNSIIIVGKEYSDVENVIEPICNKNNLKIKDIPNQFRSYDNFLFSDQIAFAEAGIPSFLIVDYPDYKNVEYQKAIEKLIDYSENIYHTPFDDLSIQIDYKAVSQYTYLLYNIISYIANSDIEINWNKGTYFYNQKLRNKKEKR